MCVLVRRCFKTISFTLLAVFQSISAEPIQVNLCLSSTSHSDRDSFLIQNFLLYQAFTEMDSETQQNCKFVLSDQGELLIEGERDFVVSFAIALEEETKKEGDAETFRMMKGRYLNSLEDLFVKTLAEEMREEDVSKIRKSFHPLTKTLCASLASAHASPPVFVVSDSSQSYYSLPISDADQQNIDELIRTMGNSGYWDLIKKKKKMDRLGDKVRHVHPLRFLGHVFSRSHLKGAMVKIMDDRLKRRGFLNGHGKKEGFAHRISREMQSNNLMQYLPGFSQCLGVNEEEISRFFYHHDWEGFLRYLVKKC